LTEPLLYLSLYFKTHRQEYYSHLQEIRTDGDWESWLKFFFEAVWITADQGVSTAQRLHSLARKDRERIESLGRIAGSALRVHHVLLSRPVASVGLLCKETGLVPNTVSKILKALIKQNIVEEVTGRSRNRLYVYRHCLEIMNEGTEAIH
jgi:Fic family protein